MTINSEPDVEGRDGTRTLARRDRWTAGVAEKVSGCRRWTMTVAVLFWWLVLVGAGPEGMTAGAQVRGRFTVLPQLLRITEEDSAGGDYRVNLSREPAEDVTVRVEGIEGTDLTVQPSSLTFTGGRGKCVRHVYSDAGGRRRGRE